MRSTIKLYDKVLKVTFWKAKDTKWIIFMAAFVITMISMLFAVGESVETSILNAVHNTSQYDVHISKLGYEEAVECMADYRKDNHISKAAVATQDFVLSIPDSSFYVSCIGIEGDYEELYKFEISEGNYPQNAEEIVVDSKLNHISDKQYQIGDEITFEIFSMATKSYHTLSYRISGFFEVPHTGGYELYGFVNIDGGKRALSQAAEEVNCHLLMKANEDTTEAVMQLCEKIPLSMRENVIINSARYEMFLENENGTNSFAGMFRNLAIFVGATSIALLFNMFQVTTVNKIQQLGLLRSIGMNRKQLIKTMLMNLGLYLVFSMLLGLLMFVISERIFGELLMHAFIDSFTQGNEYIDVQWHFNIFAFVACALMILAIMAVVYLTILLKVMKLTPLEAVHYKGEGKIKSKTGKKSNRKERSVAFVGRRNLSRNKLQTMYTGFTLGIMAVLFVSITSIGGNVDLYNVDALRKSKLFDYEFYEDMIVASIDKSIVEEIAALDSVDDLCVARRVVYELFQEEVAVINSDTMVDTRVYGEEVFVRICEENNIEYDADGRPMYLLLSDETDTRNQMVLYDIEHNSHEITIDAVITEDNYCSWGSAGQKICLLMNEAAADELFGEYHYNTLLVKANKKEDCLNQIQTILRDNGIQIYYDDLKMNMNDAIEQLQSIVYIAGYLLICFGVMVVANIICNININVNLRTREYGILLAMGMNRKQIVQLMIYEIMYVVEKVLLIAIPCALIISMYFVSGLGQEINIVKLLAISVGSGLLFYGVTYGICYVKGNQKFAKNIMRLMWDE